MATAACVGSCGVVSFCNEPADLASEPHRRFVHVAAATFLRRHQLLDRRRRGSVTRRAHRPRVGAEHL